MSFEFTLFKEMNSRREINLKIQLQLYKILELTSSITKISAWVQKEKSDLGPVEKGVKSGQMYKQTEKYRMGYPFQIPTQFIKISYCKL